VTCISLCSHRWTPDYSDRLVIEVWGGADQGVPSVGSMMTSMVSGSPLLATAYQPQCKVSAPNFKLRFKYMRVDPLTNEITLDSLTHDNCAADCSVFDFKSLVESHIPKDIEASCAVSALPNAATVMSQLPSDAQAAVVPQPPANPSVDTTASPSLYQPVSWTGKVKPAEPAETPRPAVDTTEAPVAVAAILPAAVQAQPNVPVAPATTAFDHLVLHSAFTVGRHGDRSPREQVLPDRKGAKKSKWLHKGKLTTRGFQQEYAVGRFLRATYLGFLLSHHFANRCVTRGGNMRMSLMTRQPLNNDVCGCFGLPLHPNLSHPSKAS
jgi:hypothetical protein